jgi:SprB repeat
MKRIYKIGILVFHVFVLKQILQVSKWPFSYKKLFSLLVFTFFYCTIGSQAVFSQCALTLVTTRTNITCIGCNNGAASVSVSGGTAPYSFLWTTNVTAGSANITASKDNSIYEETVTNSNGAGEYLVAGMTNAGFRNRALLAFDIAANVPAGASITGAILTMTVTHTSGASGPQAHFLHRLFENWGEGTSANNSQPGQGAPATTNDATWLKNFFPNSDWSDVGGTFNTLESASSTVNNPGVYTWSSAGMTQDIQSWYSNTSSNYGWLLRSTETGNRQAKRYGSKQNPVSTNRPELTVNYVPVVISNTSSVSNLAPGTYIVTVTDALGCIATASVIINAPSLLPTIIDQDIICTNDRTWIIDGKVYVKNNATIFINQGVVFKAVKKINPAEASALVITRSGRIDCQGTNVNPVVFTSNETVPAPGDWGGIVILGSAPLNRADTSIEGIEPLTVPSGVDIFYGGGGTGQGNPDQSSGIIRYTRIEFAGVVLSPGNELNSLTLGGVGRGTELDFIEASYGADDAFQIFGGTVNAKHLVALAPKDDAFDFEYGYSGHIQFGLSVLRLSVPFYSSDPNGIETGGSGAISNMTIIGVEDSLNASEFLQGPGSKRLLNAAHLFNTGSTLIRNSIFMGFPTGVRFDSGNPGSFQYNIVHGFRVTDQGANIDGTNTEYPGNVSNSNTSILLNDPFNLTSPDFRPIASSPAASGANFSGLVTIPANFFNIPATPTYRGAFPTTLQNWAATWSKFF